MTELEVAWSQAIETESVKAQQRPASVKPAVSAHRAAADTVAAYLEDNPGATMRGVHDATGLSLQQVNAALYFLLKHGRVEQSHRQRDARFRPVQWRIR